jgi:hypothetical protein
MYVYVLCIVYCVLCIVYCEMRNEQINVMKEVFRGLVVIL